MVIDILANSVFPAAYLIVFRIIIIKVSQLKKNCIFLILLKKPHPFKLRKRNHVHTAKLNKNYI